MRLRTLLPLLLGMLLCVPPVTASPPPLPTYVQIMKSWNGQRESRGYNRSPLIDKINRRYGVPLASSYCATSVSYAMDSSGDVIAPTYRGAMARGFLRNSRDRVPISRVVRGEWADPGDLIIYQLGRSGKGHVEANIRQLDNTHWLVVGANTSPPRGANSRDGSGFWVKVVEYRPRSRLHQTDIVKVRTRGRA